MARGWPDTAITDSADKACWSMLGFSAEVLADRYNDRLDDIIESHDAYDVVRYKQTRILYQIVERLGGDGLRLNCVYREEGDDC